MTPTPTTMTEAEGWKLVPARPTPEMYQALMEQPAVWPEQYTRMLAAAPPAPAPDDLRELREAAERATPANEIRNAGLKARDELLERMFDGGTVDDDLADRMAAIVDACANAASTRIARLESENARLREAVSFYADESNWWTDESVNEQELFGTPMGDDLGRRARTAVSEQKP